MREAHREEQELEQIRSLAKTVSGKSKMSIAQAKQWIRSAGSGGSHFSNRISKLSGIRNCGDIQMCTSLKILKGSSPRPAPLMPIPTRKRRSHPMWLLSLNRWMVKSSLQSHVMTVHRLSMGCYASFDHGATMSKLGVNDGAVTVSGWKLRAVDGFSAHTHRIKNATVVDGNFVTDELEENLVRQHGSKKDGRKLRAQCADLTSPCMEANEWL